MEYGGTIIAALKGAVVGADLNCILSMFELQTNQPILCPECQRGYLLVEAQLFV